MALSFEKTQELLTACIRAKITVLLIGSPGLGKTSVVRAVGRRVNLPVHELLASNCDAVDIAGLPYIVDGALRRSMLPQIKACVDAPGILFLDELTAVPPSVQAPLMRLLLERVAGDAVLHPDSVVLAAANKPEECPGGIEMSAASINRVIKISDFQPTISEIADYFYTLGTEESRFRDEAVDFAATLQVETNLLDMSPPRASIDAGAPFASPRAWERGLRAYAEYCAIANVGFNVGKREDEIGYTILEGAVGDAKAIAFLAIREMRQHLPSIDEILTNPKEAQVANKKERQIAAVGVIARVAERDIGAAWIYCDRLLPEIGAAAARVIMAKQNALGGKVPGKWFLKGGREAMVSLLAKIRRTFP